MTAMTPNDHDLLITHIATDEELHRLLIEHIRTADRDHDIQVQLVQQVKTLAEDVKLHHELAARVEKLERAQSEQAGGDELLKAIRTRNLALVVAFIGIAGTLLLEVIRRITL